MFWHIYDVGIRAIAWVFAVAFVISYSRVNWRQYLAGRHLMHFTWAVICFLTITLLFMLFGYSELYVWIARALFTWLAYLLYERGKIQRRYQRNQELDSTKPGINTVGSSTFKREGNDGV